MGNIGCRLAIVSLSFFLCASALARADSIFDVQLTVNGGVVKVERASSRLLLDADDAKQLSEVCGSVTPAAMHAGLADYLDGILASQGPLIEALAAPPEGDPRARASVLTALRELARTDTQGDGSTAELYRMSEGWRAAVFKYAAWSVKNQHRQPAVMTATRSVESLYKSLVEDLRFADGPLLPRSDPQDDGRDMGRVRFAVAAPFAGANIPLRPTANVQEWQRHRGEISQQVLSSMRCTLWNRATIVERVQDYLEPRGITVAPYRTTRDIADMKPLVIQEPEPATTAGVAPERPMFGRENFGGRVVLSPDPVLESVLVQADPLTQWPLVDRVLYLLLPTADWQRISQSPKDYLCTTTASWKLVPAGQQPPIVTRMVLRAGSPLQMAGTYMTRRTFGERLQRLGALGYSVRMAFHDASAAERIKNTNLVVEPDADAAPVALAGRMAGIPACDPSAARAMTATASITAAQGSSTVQPQPMKREQDKPNTFILGAQHEAGKPLRLSASLTRVGLVGDDLIKVELAKQEKQSGSVEYSRDFAFFDTLRRRLQLSASAFSNYDPDRPVSAGGIADERREGLQVRAVADLWRDWRGTFGQLELAVNHSDVITEGVAASSRRVTLAESTLYVGGGAHGTPRSERWEAAATASSGHSSPGGGFRKVRAQGAYNQFVGSFDRLDLRASAAAVTSGAPVTEWPTFGGEESVRGYRAQAAAARRVWAVQAEYWTPLSFLSPHNYALARVLRRNASLALFADAGGLSASATASSGTRTGVGAGLRLTMSEAFVLRLDWARGLGPSRGLEGGHNRFYLTVTSYRSL